MLINDYNSKIRKLIKSVDQVYIMGHKHLDLDALRSSLGIYYYTTKLGKESYIIIDDEELEPSSRKIVDKVHFSTNFIKSSEMNNLIGENSLLIIVDFNKISLSQNPNLIDEFKNILIIDHHDIGDKTIEKGLKIIDTTSSSTCEMISDFLFCNKVQLTTDLSTYLLAGIVLDTNNFVVRSSSNTFKVAHMLTNMGASPKKVQYILKQDLAKYIERQKVITNVKIIGNVAYTKGIKKVIYRREDLAKIADTLLFFNKIEASFVMGFVSKNEIGISARSMGNINVGKIMEQLGGGGSAQEAATCFKVEKIKDMEYRLLEIINLL